MKTSLENRRRMHHFTFSRLSQFALLRKSGFWLELKKGERAQVRTEMVEFFDLPFPFPINLKFGHFTPLLCSEGKEMYKKA